MKLSTEYGKSGIYRIANILTKDYYIGSSKDLGKRLSDHYTKLKDGKHFNRYLQRAWNKYGEGSFIVGVVEYCELQDLILKEQYWITKSINSGLSYNLTPTAFSQLGRKQSQEEKEKRASKLRGRKFPPEFGVAISIRKKGIPLPEITKRKISQTASRPKPERQKVLLQFSKDGAFLKEWVGVTETAKTIGVLASSLSTCLHGNRKSCLGYIWKLK